MTALVFMWSWILWPWDDFVLGQRHADRLGIVSSYWKLYFLSAEKKNIWFVVEMRKLYTRREWKHLSIYEINPFVKAATFSLNVFLKMNIVLFTVHYR